MHVLRQYEEAKFHRPYCAALGSFDGVHLGHQQIISSMIQKSEELNANSMVYTFNTHPRKVLNIDNPLTLITSNEKRIEVLKQLGLGYLYLEDFTCIARMSPEQFVKEVLIDIFNIKYVFVGYNYHFGYKSAGNSEMLAELGSKYGFGVEIFSPILIDKQIVSSSLVRDLIVNGDVEKVKDFLGRHYSIVSDVIHGRQIGKRIGIRTANIDINKDIVMPKNGVYISSTVLDGKVYKSITNVGINPTVGSKEKLNIETHILDFNGEIYGSQIEVFFVKRIRDERIFANTEDLAKQINSDIAFRLEYKE